MENKLKLYGFNNLTKSLSFNIYDVCYAKGEREQQGYITYIDEQYNSEWLAGTLERVTEIIGAHVLNISAQDYDPQGASVTFLIVEESVLVGRRAGTCAELSGEMIVAHLDKSHVTTHTYPKYHPGTFLTTFRVDVNIATCGEVTPLSTLDYLIGSFDSDTITMDYRVCGFTRDMTDKKLFMDYEVTSIQGSIDDRTPHKYGAIDLSMYQSNLFHTKMLIRDINLQNYLFNTDVCELPPQARLEITGSLRRETIGIFTGNNVY